MEVEYINPFLDAFTKTLEQLGIMDIKKGNMTKKSKFYVDSDVSAVISLKNDIQGNMALSMPENTAKKLASTMMMGMSISTIDDMAKSAIGELSSMIAGTASTMLTSAGVALLISPPDILLGPSEISSQETLSINFETSSGPIEFNIGF